MVDELKKAIGQAEKLSADDQRLIADLIMDEINWDETLKSSEKELSTLAAEALQEYKKGKTKPLNL